VIKFDQSVQKFRDLRTEYEEAYSKYKDDWEKAKVEEEKKWKEYKEKYNEYSQKYKEYKAKAEKAREGVAEKVQEIEDPHWIPVPKADIPLPLTDRSTIERLFLPKEVERRTLTVGNVGLTIRLMDKNANIVWIGNAATRSTNQQKAMQLLCEALVRTLLRQDRCAPFLISND
jgi:hypothetical protein